MLSMHSLSHFTVKCGLMIMKARQVKLVVKQVVTGSGEHCKGSMLIRDRVYDGLESTL